MPGPSMWDGKPATPVSNDRTKHVTVILDDLAETLRDLAQTAVDLDRQEVTNKRSRAEITNALLHLSDRLHKAHIDVRSEYWRARGEDQL